MFQTAPLGFPKNLHDHILLGQVGRQYYCLTEG